MVKIRYAVMPDGIRARVDRGPDGRVTTTIVLAPGMTPPARRAMLARLVRNSRIQGYGPPLSGAGVALALGWGVTRARLRDMTAPVRRLRLTLERDRPDRDPGPAGPARSPRRAV